MKKSHQLSSYVLLVFILILSFCNILLPNQKFSQHENRFLAQQPTFSWSKLISGKFTAQYEEYLTDQFIFRDFWISLKAYTEKKLFKQENNGVYFGKDGYLLQKPQTIDLALLNNNIAAIKNFTDKLEETPVYFLLAPNSTEILQTKLPALAPSNQQIIWDTIRKANNSNLHLIDIFTKFQDQADQDIYYRTDHHWTSLGAYYAYHEAGQTMGFQPLNIKEFDMQKITHDFYGTLYSKSGVRWVVPDNITIFKPKKEINYLVNYLDTGQITNSLYSWDHLDKKDKYAVFLDGNHALVKINSDQNTNRKLMIFKDSYAHSLVPFLSLHYDEIHMIDLRYFNLDIQEYLSQEKANDILFIYNTFNFSTDNSIVKLN